MRYIVELLRGLVIGIANILPGISGGMLAISMGVYDKIIHAVTQLFKEPKKSIAILFPYAVGAVAGIIGLSMVFEYLFGTFPLQTKMAFIGLIAGGLPALFTRTETYSRKEKRKGIMTTCMTCAVVIVITVIGISATGNEGQKEALTRLTGPEYLTAGRFWVVSMFLVGILAAGTMVVPGVSGSMIMMMIGVYEPILKTTNGCIRAAAAFDPAALWHYGLVLIPYYVGMAFGVFLFAGVVEHLLVKHERLMYCGIIGLVFSSPFVILWDVAWKQLETYEIFGGISLCLLGYVVAVQFGGEG